MGSLLTARNLPGIGDASPPEDDEAPCCQECLGGGNVWNVVTLGYDECPDCGGTGYQPEPEYEPGLEWEP